MKYKSLGRTGIKVSELCFGTMSFGGRADKKESEKMYNMCREAGINFFDCADVYQEGVAESYLGAFIAQERDKVVITTKTYGAMGDDVNEKGLNAKHIRLGVEASLKRLNTDYVDVLFLHQFDATVGEEETLRAVDRLVREGKVLTLGVSNFAAYQVERMLHISKMGQFVPVSVIQPMYNIAKRMAEVELLPMAESEGLGVITYSPLGGGLLTGRYKNGYANASGRLVENQNYNKRYGGQFYEQIAREYSALCSKWGLHEATLAVSWVMAHKQVTAPIIGAANTEHLKQSLQAASLTIDPEIMKAIDAISPPPPPATDRSEEQ
ncbi:aldo/keto reductase [Sphaerochaeta halotolerans]|uniref:aldo/keto reductase n=1 Tax=Sphaerochaeta halotolerans TaxID=2293840 RepID=UPI00136E5AF2|nr:aldo/keto reductase [Sphaerochaeta halotolerans]MXI85534.1 aldo/keto reductase [Sphaerochaeta halotolerans]